MSWHLDGVKHLKWAVSFWFCFKEIPGWLSNFNGQKRMTRWHCGILYLQNRTSWFWRCESGKKPCNVQGQIYIYNTKADILRSDTDPGLLTCTWVCLFMIKLGDISHMRVFVKNFTCTKHYTKCVIDTSSWLPLINTTFYLKTTVGEQGCYLSQQNGCLKSLRIPNLSLISESSEPI